MLEFSCVITQLKLMVLKQIKSIKKKNAFTNLTMSKNHFKYFQGTMKLDSLIIWGRLANIMFVFDILKSFINCPELLTRIGFRTISHGVH